MRFALTLYLNTLSPRFVGYASSPHFVSTLCRPRRQVYVPASRSLTMRLGARGLRGVLMRRMNSERYRRGRRAPRCGFSVHTTATVPSAQQQAPPQAHGTASRPRPRSPVLPVLPCLPVLPVGIDRYRRVSTGGDRSDGIYERCPSVARTFLSARDCAGRQECLPHTATLQHCG